MDGRARWAKVLSLAGYVAFLVVTLDPLEGSVLILVGAALVALGTEMGRQGKGSTVFWSWTVGLLIVGVGALWGLSALGGVGGDTGRSFWWLLICAPYPLGWLMALGGIVTRVARALKPAKAGASESASRT